jgi:hypothetical protein
VVQSSKGAGVPAGRWLPAPVAFHDPDRVAAAGVLAARYKLLPAGASASTWVLLAFGRALLGFARRRSVAAAAPALRG